MFKPPIIVRGARVHNLKNLSCEIPQGALTVVSGVSGSGKSSLVFDTLYAEGQRRYVESLSSYARQFLERIEKPDADSIEGLFPAVAVAQKSPPKGRRATVGTATEVNDYLRLLFARYGVAHCPKCKIPIERHSVDDVRKFVRSLPSGTAVFVTFPLKIKNSTIKEIKKNLRKEGFVRLFDGDSLCEIENWREKKNKNSDEVLVAVDRLKSEDSARLADSVEICFKLGDGRCILKDTLGAEYPFFAGYACKKCALPVRAATPALFSFNHPQGACPECKGFGNKLTLDEEKIISDPSLTLEKGAIEPWRKESREDIFREMLKFARANKIKTDAPYRNLTEREKNLIWRGGDGKYSRYPGIEGFFERLKKKTYKLHIRVYLSKYRKQEKCALCQGTRLREEARWIILGGKTFFEVCEMTIDALYEFIKALKLPRDEKPSEIILTELRARLQYLKDVGLGYLALSRPASTLSGGEAQRISLASILGSTLSGTMVLLDEPTIGLHPRDTGRLISALKNLRDAGNTVIVVEHDRQVISQSDYIIELGPGGGANGGKLVAEAVKEEFFKLPTLTARYLRNELTVPRISRHRAASKRNAVSLAGVNKHNLVNFNAEIPLKGLVVITGVSGSGKSTLLRDVLFAEYRHFVARGGKEKPLFCDAIAGFEKISNMVLIDQSPLERSARSNVLTVSGALLPIRILLAETEMARANRLDGGFFSFNSPKGRCEVCKGLGTIEVDMQFLANVRVLCEECGGKRFRENVLEVRYRGYNICEIMSITVNEALSLFAKKTEILERLEPIRDVGLGYLTLGQSTSALSGGEAQRMKIASLILARRAPVVYLMDEPTTGLHLDDVSKLLSLFENLIERGNSIVAIEHHTDVIKNADWVIDLGPEGGAGGGRIVAEGTPEEVVKCPVSRTARFLRDYLAP